MPNFTPEEWTRDKDCIWAGYLNQNMTHAMVAQFWNNDEATDEEMAEFVLRACRAYQPMLNAIEVALIYLEDGAPNTAAERLQEVFDKFREQEAVPNV